MEKKHKVDDDGEEDTDNDDVDADKKQGYKVLEGWESIRWRDTGASDGVHSVNTILMRTLSHNTREIQQQRQMQIQIEIQIHSFNAILIRKVAEVVRRFKFGRKF